MRFTGKRILVTGASSGIGRSGAVKLAAQGASLTLVARNAERLAHTAAMLEGSDHDILQLDVTNENDLGAMADGLRRKSTVFHGVLHSAGVHWLRPLQMVSAQSLSEMLSSHVGSSILLVRTLVAGRLLDKEGASIVWISSAAALQGGAGSVEYAAAKGALLSAARVLAVELARRKVRINVLVPGVVRTPQSDAFLSKFTPEQLDVLTKEHLLGLGEPEDVADAAAFLLSCEARWITGTTLVVDGGLTAH